MKHIITLLRERISQDCHTGEHSFRCDLNEGRVERLGLQLGQGVFKGCEKGGVAGGVQGKCGGKLCPGASGGVAVVREVGDGGPERSGHDRLLLHAGATGGRPQVRAVRQRPAATQVQHEAALIDLQRL
eukprot:scaffold262550_cov83-Attheya_sp.AAC.1